MLSQVVSGASGGGSHALTVLAPALIKLLDDATNAMGHDPVMARSCLAQALAELKTIALSTGTDTSPPPRLGEEGAWQEHRVSAPIETRLDGPILRGAYDGLHLHFPNTIIADYATSKYGRTQTNPLIADYAVADPVIEPLARYLVHAEDFGGVFGQSYANRISLAVTARLCGGDSIPAPTNRPRVSALSKWRLKRATEYVSANLAEPIGLADLATASGLSRMHFAAQFRVTTGLRPHEYLLQRRIERAQEMMLSSRLPLVEVAFDVGFKTQAHFTTVFARLVGETPNVWRQRNREALEVPILEAA